MFSRKKLKRLVLHVDDVVFGRHRPDPTQTIPLAPAFPVHLIRRNGAGQRDREAAPIHVQVLSVRLNDSAHELKRELEVRFVIHDLHADLGFDLVLDYVKKHGIKTKIGVKIMDNEANFEVHASIQCDRTH